MHITNRSIYRQYWCELALQACLNWYCLYIAMLAKTNTNASLPYGLACTGIGFCNLRCQFHFWREKTKIQVHRDMMYVTKLI